MFNKTLIVILSICVLLTSSCSIFGGKSGEKLDRVFDSLLELLSNETFITSLLAAQDTYKASKGIDNATRLLLMMQAIQPALRELKVAIDKAKLDEWKASLDQGKVPADFDSLTNEAVEKLKAAKKVQDNLSLLKTTRSGAPDMAAFVFFSNPDIKNVIELARDNPELEREVRNLSEQLTQWDSQDPKIKKASVKTALDLLDKLGADTKDLRSRVEVVNTEEAASGDKPGELKVRYVETLLVQPEVLNQIRDLVKKRINITLQPWRGDEG